jgi:hypothetical protein
MPNVMIPFKISVPESELQLLQKKLSSSTFPDEVEGAGWDHGVLLKDIRRLSYHWANEYDWRVHEARLNDELPQYTTDISIDRFGSLNIHFVYKKSPVKGAIPLLFLHGC